MSDVKHTPGPWALAARRKGGVKTVVCADKEGRYMHIVGEATSEADARMFAAAPELLAVVREACAIFDACYESEDEYNSDLASDLWKNEIHRKLTEAIAKATSP